MSNYICQLLEKVRPGTTVNELKLNGKGIEGVKKFVKYDKVTGLAFFSNRSGSTFAAIGEKINSIEFEEDDLDKNSHKKISTFPNLSKK